MFLISLHGTTLTHRASYLAQHSSFFGPDRKLIMILSLYNSINSLLIGSKCIPNGIYTNHFWANLVDDSKVLTKLWYMFIYFLFPICNHIKEHKNALNTEATISSLNSAKYCRLPLDSAKFCRVSLNSVKYCRLLLNSVKYCRLSLNSTTDQCFW